MDTAELTQAVKQKALDLGFNLVGIVAAEPSPTLAAYMSWVSAEMHGSMNYMARPDRIIRRQDLNVIVPEVKTMICVGLDYHTASVPPEIAADPSRARISNYAWGVDYHDVMTPRLKELKQWLADISGAQPKSKVYVDTGAILERSHAEQAGLGFTGKNSLLIGPQRGSFFFLGELLTTLDLIPDAPKQKPTCGSCTRCLTACPTDAFPKPYVVDARRCISYLTIEHKGSIDPALRPLMGNWVYGCDICQDVCPFNRFAIQATEKENFAGADWAERAPSLISLLELTPDSFAEQFKSSPIKRIKLPRLLRNAAIAAGNWGSPEAIPALENLRSHPDEIVTEHAHWAINQINPTP